MSFGSSSSSIHTYENIARLKRYPMSLKLIFESMQNIFSEREASQKKENYSRIYGVGWCIRIRKLC
jgi:hypothetical protein